MGLVEANLGPLCVCERVPDGDSSNTPFKDHPLDTRRQPSALEAWTLKALCCDPEGSSAVLRILSSEGRGVCLFWATQNSKGPRSHKVDKGLQGQRAPRSKGSKVKGLQGPF